MPEGRIDPLNELAPYLFGRINRRFANNRLGVFPGRPTVGIQVGLLPSTDDSEEADQRSLADIPVLICRRRVIWRFCINPDRSCLMRLRFHNGSQSSAALNSRALKALEYCLGGRENRNHLRIPIEHSKGEGAIDDAKYRCRRCSFVDCEGLEQVS